MALEKPWVDRDLVLDEQQVVSVNGHDGDYCHQAARLGVRWTHNTRFIHQYRHVEEGKEIGSQHHARSDHIEKSRLDIKSIESPSQVQRFI